MTKLAAPTLLALVAGLGARFVFSLPKCTAAAVGAGAFLLGCLIQRSRVPQVRANES